MEPHPQTAPKATVSPRKSPYFAPSSRTKNLPRKRKASAKPLQDAKKVDEFQERSQSLKRRKDDNGPAECNTLEVDGVIEPHNQKAVPDPGESPPPVGHFEIDVNYGKEDKQDVNESKAPSETIKHTEEYVKAARKAARKDLRARERAERATRSSSSPKKDSIAKLSRHMAGTESHDHSQQVSQYSPHEHGQTSNTMGTMKSQGPDLYRSQLPASIASEGPVTKATKRGPRTRVPKARSREVAARKETDPAKAAEPIEIAEGKSVSRKRKIDEDADVSEGNQKTPIAAITSINPGKKERKGPTNSSAKQSSKAEGFQCPMIRMTAAVEGLSSICKALLEELDRAFSNATAAAGLPLTLPTQQSTLRFKRSKTQLPSTRKLRSDTIGLASRAQSQPPGNDRPVSPEDRKPEKKRSKSIKVSPYFVPTPTKRPTSISCIPFPPLSSTHFGLIQETLAHSPFRLLIACIFLNKTRGSVALPVFYELMTRYPTPSALAAAKFEDVVDVIQHLGLQNQRANTCINLAKAWLEREPVKGKRRRVLHYPCRGDGKDLKPGEVIEDEDERVAWEVGQLPGVGVYAIDSWRIFCRDQLRGLPSELPDKVTEKSKEEEMQKEWARVLPLDKELRAYLRWRWLRNGIVWNQLTGERRPASEKEMETARKGGVIYEGEAGGFIIGEEVSKELDAISKGAERYEVAPANVE